MKAETRRKNSHLENLGPTRSRRRGRPPVLAREQLIAASLALLAAQGEKGFSMRRLAEELGVAPMTLYNHVQDKDELLNLLLDHMLEGWSPPPVREEEHWQLQVTAMLLSLRWHLLTHPVVLKIMLQRDRLVVLLFRPLKPLADMLFHSGLQGQPLASVLRQLIWFTVGFISIEAARSVDNEESLRQGIEDVMRQDAGLNGRDISPTSLDASQRDLWDNFLSVDTNTLFHEQLRVLLAGIEVAYLSGLPD